eukprot:c16718_g1_i2.p1 GENE.c16718_g1_i2~~c16718_g1_i2.p1  ORF type:complete len:139 (+),score=22.20 c16718_g1_i2:367-783(+)
MVFDKLKQMGLPHLVSVGRLDMQTEGLLLLTNNGALAAHLESPNSGYERRYRMRVHGLINDRIVSAMSRGVKVEGVLYSPMEVTVDRTSGTNCWLSVALREGKNRELRRVFEYFKLQTSRIIRIGYGPYELVGTCNTL